MRFKKTATEPLTLNMTPLIDVVFLLLIFFMVTTTFSNQNSININLPKSTMSQKSDPGPVIEVTVSESGEIFINQKHLVNKHQATLKRALSEILAEDKYKSPVFKVLGDAKAPHQAIVNVMDVAGQLGISKIQIATLNESA